jgi:Tfp pilus assembly protein PilP
MATSSFGKLGLAFALTGALGLLACGEEPVATTPAAGTPAAGGVAPKQAAGAATTATAEPPPVEYTYDTSVRDPFQPSKLVTSDQSDDTGCGPLCQYDTSQYKVLGIIWGISQPTAMLGAPDGKPYIVKMGAPIGKNKGKVVSITKDRIAVLEKYVNYLGEVVTNRVDITLPDQEGARK